MQFLSLQFFIFFVILLVLLVICRKKTQRQWVLLAASYIFYAYWDYRYLFLLLLQTIVAYLVGLRAEKSRKNARAFLTAGIVITLLVLGVCKYFDFFVDSFCNMFGIESQLGISMLLPVGISFYTFQAISYMVDVYRGTVEGTKSFRKIALYVGFFPQILSGPIVKAHDFLPQLEKEHRINKTQIIEGAQIFLLGVVKKFVIADRLGVCVDAVYAAPEAYSWTSILIAVVAYSFQIYCDFSGYSDMAIGVARAMGYDLGINFNCPYIATGPSEFWRRWHISLSSWFKEYMYFPLGGSRKGFARTLLNLFIVMLLSGLWHGAAWTFVFWGVLHGIGSVAQKIFRKAKGESRGNTAAKVISVVINFIFVTFCWIFFRADSFENAFSVLRGIFTLQSGIQYIYIYGIVYIAICIIGHLYVAIFKKGEAIYPLLNYKKFSSWLILWLVILLTIVFFYVGDTAFIYSQF